MALSAPRDTKEMTSPFALRSECLGGTSQDFYKGQLVAVETADGRLYPAVAGDLTRVTVGRCEETYSTGASETAKKIKYKSGIFNYTSGTSGEAIAADDRYKPCYVLDDESVGLSGNSGANAVAGMIYDVDSDGVWVSIGAPIVGLRGPTGATGATGPTGPTGP